jgi:diaminopimelate epimerase
MIEFFKMSGSGNDFILIDNRNHQVSVEDVVKFVRDVCERRVSVGSDGLILIENSGKVDFRWRFFNADGSEVDMCGNGGRCAARFAFIKGIAKERMSFETGAGIIDAEVKEDVVKIKLTDPRDLKTDYDITIDGTLCKVSSINTGVPHVVFYTDELEAFDIVGMGRIIRFHEAYRPAGTNANFVTVVDRQNIRVRTYERGVEDETLACGTGSVASALVSSWKGLVDSPVSVLVKSGEILRVHFEKTPSGFKNVYLEGSVRVIYQGCLWKEAYNKR